MNTGELWDREPLNFIVHIIIIIIMLLTLIMYFFHGTAFIVCVACCMLKIICQIKHFETE